ncbi:MAG: GNAT family N-acetyltransferase [Sedimentibacter sp.]
MEIRKTKLEDINAIMQIYAQAKEFMKINGNPNQWGKEYPAISLIQKDIESGNSFVAVEGGKIVGTFYFVVGEEPTYVKIYDGEWLDNEPYGVVHRIASANGNRGFATFCLNWCFEKSKNIRIDTHRDNIPMQKLLVKTGFIYCGIIYLENGDERIAYQKNRVV